MRVKRPSRERPGAISLRVTADLKKAIEDAADADMRTVQSLLELVLTKWARDNGLLPTKETEDQKS